ncbi:TBC1 domain family member 7 [Trichoplax sp. H2]|nr:TBC1 domain family member 7 [Trichoplax sp. H2]|eukprot:RDD44646.1 TBC1 domain family member 7 [Trichoplax sp. H2]
MAFLGRNVRSNYYDTLGFVNDPHRKQGLENLLKENVIDIKGISTYLLKFDVPAKYRVIMWELLLGILPKHRECHTFIMTQLKESYHDLKRAALITNKSVDESNKPNLLISDFYTVSEPIKPLARLIFNVVKLEEEAYMIFRSFVKLQQKWSTYTKALQLQMQHFLELEDHDLYQFLDSSKILPSLPLSEWFETCYAGILQDSTLHRILDKVIAGSRLILLFVAITILISFKESIMTCNEIEMLPKIVNIPYDRSEAIAAKSIETWERYGSLLI